MCGGAGRYGLSAGHPLWRLGPYRSKVVKCPLCEGAGKVDEKTSHDYLRRPWRLKPSLRRRLKKAEEEWEGNYLRKRE